MIRPALAVTLVFLFSLNAFSIASRKDYLNAKLLFCSGDLEKINQGKASLDQILKNEPNNLKAYSLRHFFLPNDSDTIFDETIEKIRSHKVPASEFERVLFTDVSFELPDTDVKVLDSWLDFNSKDPFLESERLYLAANVSEVHGDFQKAYDLFLKSLSTDPGFNPIHLIPFFTGNVEAISKKDMSKVAPFLSHLNELDEKDNANVLLNVVIGRSNRELSDEQILKEIEPAYFLCVDDQRVALAYTDALLWNKLPQQAYDVAKKFVAAHKHHSLSWELKLLNSSLWTKRVDEGDSYIKFERTTFAYRESAKFRGFIENYAAFSKKIRGAILMDKVKWLFAPFVIIGLFALIYWLSQRPWKSGAVGASDFPEGTNVEELNIAEGKAHDDQKHFAILKNFSSEEGYRQSDMVDMVSYLNSQGIDATYSTSLLYYSQNFSLQVRVDQMKAALELLKNYKKT